MECDSNYGLIVAANCLKIKSVRSVDKHIQNDKKFKPFNFVNGFICGALDTLERKHSTSTKSTNSITNYKLLNSDENMYPTSSSTNFIKQDSSSSTSSSNRKLSLSNNEDYVKYIENHERNLEKSHSNSSTLKSTKGKLRQPSPPIKPTSTILSLEDRDLVVIDRQDINESTSNESDVIILDPPIIRTPTPPPPPQQSDLKDILGGDWPREAGDVANLLNNKTSDTLNENHSYYGGTNNIQQTTSYNYKPKTERVKSINPISHIMTSSRSTLKNQTNRGSFVDGQFRKGNHH